MWSLGKVLKTPEVVRVYSGSFWNQPYQNEEFRCLFEAEQEDLLKDLYGFVEYISDSNYELEIAKEFSS